MSDTLGLDSLGALSYFGEMDHDMGDQSFPLSGEKRKADSSSQLSGGESGKKRFIWPASLHHRFVAAVFDIGLRTSTPKDVLSVMSTNDPSCDVNFETCKSQLLKMRAFRDPDRPGHKPYYDNEQTSSDDHLQPSVHSLSRSNSLPQVNPRKKSSSQDDMQRSLHKSINDQIRQVSHAISLQRAFLDHLQASIHSQNAIYMRLVAEGGSDVQALAPSIRALDHDSQINSQLQPHSQYQPQYQPQSQPHQSLVNPMTHSTTKPLSSAAYPQTQSASSRAELSMIHEMREQMNLHRRLLLKKEASIPSDDSSPPPQTIETSHTTLPTQCFDLMPPLELPAAPTGAAVSGALLGTHAAPLLGHNALHNGGGLWDEDALFFFLDNEFSSSPIHESTQSRS